MLFRKLQSICSMQLLSQRPKAGKLIQRYGLVINPEILSEGLNPASRHNARGGGMCCMCCELLCWLFYHSLSHLFQSESDFRSIYQCIRFGMVWHGLANALGWCRNTARRCYRCCRFWLAPAGVPSSSMAGKSSSKRVILGGWWSPIFR